MRLTGRGWKLIAVLVILSIYSMLVSDFLTLAASLALIALIAVALTDFLMKSRKSKGIRVEPRELEVKIKAGDRGELLFKIYSETPLILKADEKWLRCEPETILPPESLLKLVVSSPRSGVYELSNLEVEISDAFGVFEASIMIPLSLRVKVYPRVLPWIMEAVRLIGESSPGLGEAPGKRKGLGLEYLWSREYQPGDSIRFVDWKATARLQKIIVKEFLEEGYGSVKIIYDLRAHGPVSNDECSAYFLSAVVSSARSGLPISLTIKNGDEVIVDREDLNPLDALKLALAHVIEPHFFRRWDVYEFVEPKSARMLTRILGELGSEAFREIVKSSLESVLKSLRRILKRSKTYVIYVGCILIHSTFVKELGSEVAEAGGRLMVLTPRKPWIDAENLEEAYLMYQSHGRLLRALEKLGAKIGHERELKAVTS